MDKKSIQTNKTISSASPSQEKAIWGVTSTLFLGICIFIVPQVLLAFLVPTVEDWALSGNLTNFILALLIEVFTLALIVIFVRAYGHGLPKIGLGRFKLSYLGLAVFGFFAYFLLSMVTSWLFGLVVPYDQSQAQELGFDSPVGIESLLIFVALVVMAPLAEEMLFRGFIFTGLRHRLGFVITTIIVSGLFALVHFQINVGLDVFALSLVLCYLREKTGSLWPSIALHAGKNALAFLLIFVYDFPV